VLRCLSLETGAELWSYSYDAPGRVGHPGSRSTPTVTDQHVYTVGMTGHLYCVDRNSHRPVWHRDLARDFPPAESLRWGYSQAPLIEGNLVIVAPQSRKGSVVAFSRLNGDVVWASPLLGPPGYSSPILVDAGGMKHVAMVSAGRGGVSGLSLDDGSVLWRYDGWQCRIPIPFPTQLPGDRLFITGEYGAGSAMIRIVRQGAGFKVEELFVSDDCESQIHQPLFHEGHLYMNSNGNSRNDGMLCLALDGTVRWRTRDASGSPRFERGGLLMADGLIVNLDGRDGTLYLIEPAPAGYRELASAKVVDGPQAWSPMAIADGRLVLRDLRRMVCVDLRDERP
jgi:outer membrane protein assembly factor BamB